jgi:hypothetical protein
LYLYFHFLWSKVVSKGVAGIINQIWNLYLGGVGAWVNGQPASLINAPLSRGCVDESVARILCSRGQGRTK